MMVWKRVGSFKIWACLVSMLDFWGVDFRNYKKIALFQNSKLVDVIHRHSDPPKFLGRFLDNLLVLKKKGINTILATNYNHEPWERNGQFILNQPFWVGIPRFLNFWDDLRSL